MIFHFEEDELIKNYIISFIKTKIEIISIQKIFEK